jgi:hypothetical protein
MNGFLIAAIAVAAMGLSIGVGWWLTRVVLRIAAHSPDAGAGDARQAGRDESDGPEGPRASAALRGGTWIGILERAAITGAVLAGYPAAIAFVIAIKGLGRYPELRDNPGASERFVIGTLASMTWAAAVGLAGQALLS